MDCGCCIVSGGLWVLGCERWIMGGEFCLTGTGLCPGPHKTYQTINKPIGLNCTDITEHLHARVRETYTQARARTLLSVL